MLEKIRQFFSRMKERLPSQKNKEDEMSGFHEPGEVPDKKDQTVTQKLNHLIAKLKSVKKSDLIDPFAQIEQETKKNQKKLSLSQLDFPELIVYLSSPKFYTKFHHYFLVSFLLLSMYTVGKISALFLRGDVPTGVQLTQINMEFDTSKELTRQDINTIKSTNPFKTGSAKVVDDKKLAMQQKCEEADQKTDLPITLKNTIVLQDSVKSIASIQVRSKDVEDFRQGEKIGSMAKLERVERLRVILKNLKTGACQYAENNTFDQGVKSFDVMDSKSSKAYLKKKSQQKGIKSEGNSFTIDRSLITEKMQDLSSVLTQAKATPLKNPDGTMSFKLDQVQPGGIFATLGVQDGDTITKINGKNIESVNEVMKLMGDLSSLSNVNLTITRDGTEENLDYTFK